MPKIEVNERLFFNLLGTQYDYDTLEDRLTCGKAELAERLDAALPDNQRVIKIELNDTNRPDLWSTAGIARQLRLHKGGKATDYSSFLSTKDKLVDCAAEFSRFVVEHEIALSHHSLTDAMAHFNLDWNGIAHTSAADAQACRLVFEALFPHYYESEDA